MYLCTFLDLPPPYDDGSFYPILPLQVTKLHFDDLKQRYGPSIVVLNLVKSKERRPRETILRRELSVAIAMINVQEVILGRGTNGG